MTRVALLLVTVICQSLSPAAQGQLTTTDSPPATASGMNLALIASSCVPASFVALLILILSAVYVKSSLLANYGIYSLIIVLLLLLL